MVLKRKRPNEFGSLSTATSDGGAVQAPPIGATRLVSCQLDSTLNELAWLVSCRWRWWASLSEDQFKIARSALAGGPLSVVVASGADPVFALVAGVGINLGQQVPVMHRRGEEHSRESSASLGRSVV